MHRRALLTGLAAGALAAQTLSVEALAAEAAPDKLGFKPDPAFLEKAVALLKTHAAVDTHAHPGETMRRGLAPTPAAAEAVAHEAQAVAEMREGLQAAASFAAVADTAVLRATPTGIVVDRDYAPGEAMAVYRRQIVDLHAVAQKLGLPIIRKPSDLDACAGGKAPGMIVTVEGGDFLGGDASGLKAARDKDDVRIITVVHYRPNELADNQTSPPRFGGGLSPAGVATVKEMARLGIVIDVAHAAETSVHAALANVSVPLLCSHTHVKTPAFDHPRFITKETARAIAQAGGVIGSWPSGFGGVTLSDFVDRIFVLTEVVGPAHAAIGTDMDGNFQPTMSSYRQLPLLVSELLKRGYGEANVAGLVGGNFRRLFDTAWRAKKA
jgi:membrane dipeptidase